MSEVTAVVLVLVVLVVLVLAALTPNRSRSAAGSQSALRDEFAPPTAPDRLVRRPEIMKGAVADDGYVYLRAECGHVWRGTSESYEWTFYRNYGHLPRWCQHCVQGRSTAARSVADKLRKEFNAGTP